MGRPSHDSLSCAVGGTKRVGGYGNDASLDYAFASGRGQGTSKEKSGIGGGGNSIINKYNNKIYCGGGGGYLGGKGFSYDTIDNKKSVPYPQQYVYGYGGTSFISDMNIDNSLFKHDFNNSNGYAIIYQINN